MARDPRGGGSEEDDIDHKSVKHLLDSIGKIVHDQVKKDANDFGDELKGKLQEAKGMGETVSSIETCDLVKQYYERVNKGGDANSERHPCRKEEVKRFSDTLGGQCTDHRIKGNERNKTGGACAPLRRLHLCNKNMEKIATSMTKHDLLAEVCMAAKFEGQSIKTHYPKYEALYEGSGFTTCTMLARSFADIGDIVRGRDLYLGYDDEEKKQRDQLEQKLKEIFKEIHEGLTTTNGKKGQKSAKDHYQDKNGGNFFKLREDWWTANRETVWKAITCDVKSGSQYFRQTCGSGNWTKDNCRCDGSNADQVPTYFDYVPQYLRWFEEWAEDFCRKKKHKLKDAIQKCREKDKSGEERYCDLNRHDCKKTVRGEHVFFEESDCNDCSVACKPFVKWIDNQKLEFLKQKRKYTSEIKKYTNGTTNSKRKKRSTKSETYEGYEKKFYEQLKTDYGTVNKFLEKLNEEDVCKKITDEKEGIIHFEKVNSSSASGDGSNKTFDHTEYCQACPWCGAQKENGGKGWKAKNDGECGKGKEYGNYENTQIPILTGDKGQLDMVRKYKKFCNGNGGNGATGTVNGGAPGGKGEKSKNGASGKNGDNITETWTCYYYKKNEKDVGNGAINFCVQQKQDNHEKKKYSMSYNAFFWDWVYHMLHDSLDWRNELKSCIDKDKSEQCENKCNSKCDCFLKWVNEKKTEWKAIKDHFGKQKDIEQQTKMDTGVTLELLLEKDLLLKSIEDTHVDANDIEHIRKMLKDEETEENVDTGTEQKSIIDKLLNHEERIAKKCKETHKDDQCKPKAQQENLARAETATSPNVQPASEDDDEDLDNEEDDDEDEDEEDQAVDATKKSKPPVDLLRVLNIPKGDYDIPTLKSSNRYIPYGTDKYRGKRYIYVEGDTDEDKYMFMSDTTDVTSSESEYEELDINEIYPYQSPKYKTLIEVVLEPSKRDIPSSDTPMNKFTDNEWNQLKHDFISQYLPNIQPNDYTSGNIPLNTQPNTLYFDKPEEKPFIMSIHDRNLYSGEEISYNMSTNSGENNLYSGQNNVYDGIDPTSDNRDSYSDKNGSISDIHHPYSGIDLINDALNGDYDIYDEILKRKENELFGTKHHTKHTNTYNVAKPARDDPITNQINLFHKWLDRHRDMCEKWDTNNKVDILNQLKEEWNKENNNNVDKTYNSDNKSSHNHVLNTDVSIQIDMDNPKTKNEITNMDTNPDKSTMDTILDDLEKYNEPYYYDFYEDDIIYHDVDVEKSSMDDIYVDHNNVTNNNMDVPTKMHIEMNIVNNKKEIFEEEYPISDIWNI
ncbi:hypothetical protein PFNF135_02139 [Plasmodium falciparum NF135/5.C10]|uniref:Erythrocyte membrane protein 1 n=1 Tax=Plasmodium falciparum NF135/5.C10 TaxID=1036726 RepID=W4IJJ4_PLAFA|nr:hypothetical protein PFNF135_02139 [Plasmodium falciparum NF135/5.C10]